MPKMKKTKKHKRRTFPSIGNVSNSNITRIRMPKEEKKDNKLFIDKRSPRKNGLLGILLIALKGLNTLIVLIAVKFKFSTCKKYSKAPDITMKKSKRFHESARYVPRPHPPMAIIFIVISNEKNAKITSSKICNYKKGEN